MLKHATARFQASICCCWLLLPAAGCCWLQLLALLLAAAGCCWLLLLLLAGCHWLLLTAPVCSWLLLAAPGCCLWLLLLLLLLLLLAEGWCKTTPEPKVSDSSSGHCLRTPHLD